MRPADGGWRWWADDGCARHRAQGLAALAIAQSEPGAGFWFQIAIMMANDVVWVVFWVLFLDKVGAMRGWDTHKVLLLFAILATVTGAGLGLLANARRLGELIAGGGLDAALALPTNPLTYLLTRRVDAALLGDLAFGPVLFCAAGDPTPERAVARCGPLEGGVLTLDRRTW